MKKRMGQFDGLKLDELKKKLDALREEIRASHFKTEGAKSKNVKEVGMMKKNIARVLTLINQASK
ncbi:50S ribosomal protein L29 [Patescibacteria group bacterium]|nr:50S ribosomal protein L29 [Patescibacteria group bacterium]